MPTEEVFATTIQKTNELLKDIEKRLGWEGHRNQSYAVLRAVLHALRDRLPVNEATELGAQLTILIRGVYYEGWKPSRVPIKMSKQDFIESIAERFNFSIEVPIEELIHVVITTIRDHIDAGEAEKIANILPEKFEEFFE